MGVHFKATTTIYDIPILNNMRSCHFSHYIFLIPKINIITEIKKALSNSCYTNLWRLLIKLKILGKNSLYLNVCHIANSLKMVLIFTYLEVIEAAFSKLFVPFLWLLNTDNIDFATKYFTLNTSHNKTNRSSASQT